MNHQKLSRFLRKNAMQISKRHHYIPCFYTSLWTRENGRLCQYSRPHRTVKPERKYPKQVGFGPNLYNLPGVSEENRSYLEDKFFARVDGIAAVAVQYILSNRTTELSEKLRSGFARLMTGFFYRTPDKIVEIKRNMMETLERVMLDARTNPSKLYNIDAMAAMSIFELEDNLRQDVLNRLWGVSLRDVIDDTFVNTEIMRMGWTVCELDNAKHDLLTSDSPLVMSNGFAHYEGHISIALGPKRLFIATNNKETYKKIVSVGPDKLVKKFNQEVVRQARTYVYGIDDRQLRFVENRLSRVVESRFITD